MSQYLELEDPVIKQNQWRERVFSRHLAITGCLRKQHKEMADVQGLPLADVWLQGKEKSLKIGRSGLYCDSPDQDFKDYAEAKSKKIEKQIYEAYELIGASAQQDKRRINDYIRSEVIASGVDYPLAENDYSNREMIAAMARVCDPAWWRRRLRQVAARQYEKLARDAGVVGLSGNIYCSNFSVRRRAEQKRRNRQLLESLEAVNQEGQVYTLAELSDLSVSNPINRRNELMTRIAGFESYAKQHPFIEPDGAAVPYTALFLTLTAPSKYHARTIRRRSDGSRYCIPNSKFNGSDPRQVNDYLCELWASIRAEWARRSINPFGFRMAEPHHDGTPHWHMILFVPDSRLIEASYVFHHYAMREDATECGAEEYRCKIVAIDPAKGSAAGYCAKYVAKNIDGFGIDADLYGRDAVTSALRIEAWAGTWGIRQFQQIGGPSVTVWRESRRVRLDDLDCQISEKAKGIIAAADGGDWDQYTELMGGAVCPRKDRPLRAMMVVKPEFNRYGEFVEVVRGLLESVVPIVTRCHVWRLQPVGTAEKEAQTSNWSASLSGFMPRDRRLRDLDLCQ